MNTNNNLILFILFYNINYKIYGVNWDHSFTLEEINTTRDIDQFDRLVYKVSKKGG